MKKPLSILVWVMIAALGAAAFGVIALSRGETISAAWLVIAGVSTYLVAYRFYSRYLAYTVFGLDERRATPAERLNNGRDFVPTNRWVAAGHHFSAISGAGPLVGPTLAAQFGFLPGTLWLIVGVVLGGAVQDMIVLWASVRRDGKSLGQMAKEEVNPVAGVAGMVAIFAIMIILLAVLALVVVNALRDSPWGLFTIAATIPIALLMGAWMKNIRPGKVAEATGIGIALLLAALLGWQWVAAHPAWGAAFTWSGTELTWAVIVYGFVASVLPVWLLLAPRDYLSAFLKIGTILVLGMAILLLLPPLQMPAVTQFIDGTGPVFAGKLFPFAFITIACGAVSGFHALIASGTTPKILSCESDVRLIGYGGMLGESLVGLMAMIAAATLDPGVYFAMNVGPAILGPTAETASQANAQWGFVLRPEQMGELARQMGEATLMSRTGGAPSLAVGMAGILGGVFTGGSLAIWYHFAILFEAVFILTTIDAGTASAASCCRSCSDTCTRRSAAIPGTPHHPFLGSRRARMGLLPVPGRCRSARRDQFTVAAVRNRQSTTGCGGAVRGNHDPHKDGETAARLGDACAARVARCGDADRRVSEGLLTTAPARLPCTRAISGELDRPERPADDLQRPARRRPRALLHVHRSGGDRRVRSRVVDGRNQAEGARRERGALCGIETGFGERVTQFQVALVRRPKIAVPTRTMVAPS